MSSLPTQSDALLTLPLRCRPAAQAILPPGEPIEWSYGHRDFDTLHWGLALAVKVQLVLFPLAALAVGIAAMAGAFPTGPGLFGLSLAASCVLIAVFVGAFYLALSYLLVRHFDSIVPGMSYASILTTQRLVFLASARSVTSCFAYNRTSIEDAHTTKNETGVMIYVLGPYRVRAITPPGAYVIPGAGEEGDGRPPGSDHSLGSGPQAEAAARQLLERLGFPPIVAPA